MQHLLPLLLIFSLSLLVDSNRNQDFSILATATTVQNRGIYAYLTAVDIARHGLDRDTRKVITEAFAKRSLSSAWIFVYQDVKAPIEKIPIDIFKSVFVMVVCIGRSVSFEAQKEATAVKTTLLIPCAQHAHTLSEDHHMKLLVASDNSNDISLSREELVILVISSLSSSSHHAAPWHDHWLSPAILIVR